MAPVGLGVRWIDAVATIGAAVEPGPPWSWIGWLVLVVVVSLVVMRTGRESGSSEVDDAAIGVR